MISFPIALLATSSWMYDCDYVQWTGNPPRAPHLPSPLNMGRNIDWGGFLLKHLPRDMLYGNASHGIGPDGRTALRNSINAISRHEKQKQQVDQLIRWILEHRTPAKRICWPKHDTWEILTSYSNMLDGLHNLFVREDSLRYDVAATFARGDPKPIDPDRAYCINGSSPYYTDIARVIVRITDEKLTSSNMRNYLDVFQHPFLHALAAASRDEFRCSFMYGCTSHLRYGQPMLPDSFDHLWATVIQAFAFKLPQCLIFSAVPDLNPDHVYIIGGVQA
ncbi:hypothetical protein CP533_4361 [Ophiocordyceps camponoti-saundersi (nom. inval.)]|nr:hypothetical protein CP533_4361 [Ophiocordyceps camponoti-saundersi (nom. inval.)]